MGKTLWTHYLTFTLAASCSTLLTDVANGNVINNPSIVEEEIPHLDIKPTRTITSSYLTNHSGQLLTTNQDNGRYHLSHGYLTTTFSLINISHEVIPIKNDASDAKHYTKFSQSFSQNRTKIARAAVTDVIGDSAINFERYTDYINTFYTTHFSQEDGQYYYKSSASHEYSVHVPKIEDILLTTRLSANNDNLLRPVIHSTLAVTPESLEATNSVTNEHMVTSFKFPEVNILSTSKSVIIIVPFTATTEQSDFSSSSSNSNNNNNNNKVDVLHSHRDSNESENKDLGVIIKPTPSQDETDTDRKNKKGETHEGTTESNSRTHEMEMHTPSQSLADRTRESKLETLHHFLSDSAETKAKAGKTPDLKSLPASISIETIQLFSSRSTSESQTSSHSYSVTTPTSTEKENEISNSVTVLLTDVPEKNDATSVSQEAILTTSESPVGSNAIKPESCISDNSLCRQRMFNLTLSFTWPEFCLHSRIFQLMLLEMLNFSSPDVNVTLQQIVVINSEVCGKRREENNDTDIWVSVYVTSKEGKFDRFLTNILRKQLRPSTCPRPTVCGKITKYYYEEETQEPKEPSQLVLSNSGFVAGVSISVVAAVCIILLGVLMLVLRWRSSSASLNQEGRSTRAARPSFDAYSLASFSTGQRKRKSRISLRSFLNQAFEDPEIPSRPLNLNNLTNILSNRNLLEEEFKKLPLTMPLPETVPSGAEIKNRYANVLPVPETRVRLMGLKTNDLVAEYINANTVRGYGGKSCQYIACQAPLPDGVEDFWRMVWEQQSRMILMITLIQDNGIQRCAPYFPDNTVDCHRSFGDFQITLQSKDVREHFTVSTLRLYEMEKNLFRDVIHLWYRSWPPHSVPSDTSTIVTFMLETRKHSQRNAGPLVVHCSPGTGRTGTIMAIDSCMREYDESRLVDVPRCIYRLRQDRAGAVQTPEQYIFIHEVLQEYCVKIGTQSQRPSLKSLISFKMSH